jgi:hypothetical protein
MLSCVFKVSSLYKQQQRQQPSGQQIVQLQQQCLPSSQRNAISTCAQSTQGDRLLAEAGMKTARVIIDHTPYVVIDGEHRTG